MRYELTDDEWTAIRPMLPNKPRGVPATERVSSTLSRGAAASFLNKPIPS
jgi:transposase